MTYADGSTVNYDYDKNSNLDFVTLPGAYGTMDYVYDTLNRLTAKNYPANPTRNKIFNYDIGSRLTSANTTAAQNSYTYDTLNRVLTNTQTLNSTPYTLSYQYDSASNRTRLTYPSGKVVDYTYDNNDRMDLVRVNSVTVGDYDYDPLDRRITKILRTPTPETQATYQYDLANQLLSLTNTVLPATPISTYAYTYDNVGNRLSMTAPSGTHNYTYNNIYELTGVSGAQTHTFAYDKVANRTTADGVAYTANTLNQYSTVGSTAYTYDQNGNLTNDGTTAFTFDEENRLTTATKTGMTAGYGYDAFNRRVSKTVNGTTEYFVYDDEDIIEDRTNTGSLTADYVHGSRIDEVLTMSRGGNTYYYHHDGLGSVTEITNSAGTVIENYSYDVYGQPSVVTSSISNRYRFTGREFDEETGLSHYRARAYSPMLGRFLQRDPIGYYDSMNLFQYVGNSPVNYVDSYGLKRGDRLYGYPKDFWNWYHRNWKMKGDDDVTKEEAEEAYDEWVRQGKPKVKDQGGNNDSGGGDRKRSTPCPDGEQGPSPAPAPSPGPVPPTPNPNGPVAPSLPTPTMPMVPNYGPFMGAMKISTQ